MTTPTSHAECFRLEIRRAGESFETHGFFESVELVRQAAEGDIVSCGDCLPRSWMCPESADQLSATAPLHIGVPVMDHRVFLNGSMRDQADVRIVEQAVAQVSDVGEVVDLLEVEI